MMQQPMQNQGQVYKQEYQQPGYQQQPMQQQPVYQQPNQQPNPQNNGGRPPAAYPVTAPDEIRAQTKFSMGQQLEEQQHSYIKKVFAIVAVQFSFSTAMCILASYDRSFAMWCAAPAPFGISCVVNIMTFITIYCTPLRKKVPMNYILLLLFTVSETIMFSALCGYIEPSDVIVACACVWMAASSLCLAALLVPITAGLIKGLIISLLIGFVVQLTLVIVMCVCGIYGSFVWILWFALGFGISGLLIFVDVIVIQI